MSIRRKGAAAARRRLTAEFREAFVLSDIRVSTLAAQLHMPTTTLGRWMSAREVRSTPLTRSRFKALAQLLGFNGEIFRPYATVWPKAVSAPADTEQQEQQP
jgi:transposase-like protein